MNSPESKDASSADLRPVRAESVSLFRPHSSAPPAIPDHELLWRIGSGSYGEVWLARDVLGQYRAVKIVYRHSFDQDKPYEREFAGIRKFEPISREHEGHVDILHVGRNDAAGHFYYVMELADDANVGQASSLSAPLKKNSAEETGKMPVPLYAPRTLKHDLRARGALPVAECVQIALSLTRALEHLHAHGLVHRDIKPSNIIFVKGAPKLADIGLVTSVDATRSFVGTDGYIPPEGPGTPPGDLYSLGKVLYEAVTGKDRLDFPELPADWRTRPDFDQLLEFNEILTKACDDEPRQRYESAAKMRDELEVLERGESVKRKRRLRQRRGGCKKVAVAVVLLSAATAAALFLLRGQRDGELHSVNPEAEALVAKGNQILMSGTPDQVGKAKDYFAKAAEKDPDFAPAYIGIWRTRMAENTSGFANPPADAVPKLRAAAKKLIEMAPELAETRIASSWLKFMDESLSDALAEARKATTMHGFSKSGLGLVHGWYGWYLMRALDPEAGKKELLLAARECPGDPVIEAQLGHACAQTHDFQSALEHYRTSIDMQPLQTIAYLLRANLQEEDGKIREAIQDFRQWNLMAGENEAESKADWDDLQNAFQQGGPEGYWSRRLQKALEAPPQNPLDIATYLAHLGKDREAYDRLAKLDNRELQEYLWCDICFDRKDPRFQELVRKADTLRYKQH